MTGGRPSHRSADRPATGNSSPMTPMDSTRVALEEWLAAQLAQITGFAASQLNAATTLEEMALESMAVMAFNRVVEPLFPQIPKAFIYDCRTIADIAEYLLKRYPNQVAALAGQTQAATDTRSTRNDSPAVEPAVIDAFVDEWEPLCSVASDDHPERPDENAIAVIGIAGRFPQAVDLHAFAENLAAGRDCIEPVPPSRWDAQHIFSPISAHKRDAFSSYSKWGGFVQDVDRFDSTFFGIASRDADVMDPQERLFLECSYHALEHAGLGRERLPRDSNGTQSDVGVFVGVTTNSYSLLGPASWQEGGTQVPASMPWSVANRVSFALDFSGPSIAIDTACSSSLTAIHLACKSLQSQECAIAIAGGVNLYLHPSKYVQLCQQKMLSPTGKCHSFGAAADGFAPGEGVAAVVLRPLKDALAHKDRILGVIRACEIGHGGRTNGYTVPSSLGQSALIRRALDKARIDSSTIGYVEAHGTGTSLGDPVEVEGLVQAWNTEQGCGQRVGLGSLKANIGHLESAAAVAGLIKILLQFQEKKIFPSLHASALNPAIQFEATPFFIPNEIRDWPVTDAPRRASLSSFGAGGANGYLIVEEAPTPPRVAASKLTAAAEVFVFSANSARQLDAVVANFSRWLDRNIATLEQTSARARIAYTLQLGRTPQRHRAAIVAKTLQQLVSSLRAFSSAAEANASEDGAVFRGIAAVHSRRDESAPAVTATSQMLATAWVSASLEWAPYWSEALCPIELPPYPFERLRHWIKQENAAASLPPTEADEHLRTDSSPETRCAKLRPTDPLVADHVVNDRRIYPAAGYLSLCLTQPDRNGNDAIKELRDLTWSKPLIVDGEIEVRIEWMSQDPTQDRRFCITSHANGERSVHVAGMSVSAASASASGIVRTTDDTGTWSRIDPADCYRRFRAMGFAYGPSLQTIVELRRNGTRAHARLRASAIERADRLQVDASLLDGVFQCAIALAPEEIGRGTAAFVPFSLKALRLRGPIAEEVEVLATYKGQLQGALQRFDFLITDRSGKVLAELEDFCFRQLRSPDKTRIATAAVTNDPLLFASRWTEQVADEQSMPATNDAENTLVIAHPGALLESLIAALETEQPDSQLWTLEPASAFRFVAPRHIEADLLDSQQLDLVWQLLQHRQAMPTRIAFCLAVAPLPASDALPLHVRQFSSFAKSLLGAASSSASTLLYFYRKDGDLERLYDRSVIGVLRTIGLEAPCLDADLVGLSGDQNTLSRAIAATLSTARPRSPIARHVVEHERLADHSRVRTLVRLPRPASPWVPTPAKVYLVTGALGAIGRELAGWLARHGAHLALVGRSALDSSSDAFVRSLRVYGSEVHYYSADISRRNDVERVLSAVKRDFGGLHGVFHLAGVLRDNFFARHAEADWNAILAPKVRGAQLLDELTQDEPLDAFVVFSSLASVYGNVGQGIYAYANAWLDCFAAWRHEQVMRGQRAGRSLSISWPLWKTEQGMQAPPAIVQWMSEQGLDLLSSEAGLQALGAAIADTEHSHIVVCAGDAQRIEALLGVAPHSPALHNTPLPGIENTMLRLDEPIIRLVESVTHSPAGRITMDMTVESIGLDSLMVIDLNKALEPCFPELSKTVFYEITTLSDLAEHLTEHYPSGVARWLGRDRPPLTTQQPPPPRYDEIPDRGSLPAKAPTVTRPTPIRPGDIAIVGLAGRYPHAADLDEFWQNLVDGIDCIDEIRTRWPDLNVGTQQRTANGKSGLFARWAGLMDDFDKFDPLFFGISPRDAERMDPQERWFLQTAWHAVENAGYTPQGLQFPPSSKGGRANVGVVAGVMYGEYQFYGAAGSATLSNSSYAAISNRVSYCLDLTGPSLSIDSMCSSSLTSIHLACEWLRTGACDSVLAGGVNLSVHPYRYRMLSELQFASTDGRCRSFGEGGDGYVPGEGVGVVVLKRLEDALEDGDYIHGVIKGSHIGHGGRTSAFTVPNPHAQAEAIRRAFSAAGVDPKRIGYVESHGTGTSLGDPIEIRGLELALKDALDPTFKCPIGSVKSVIGHLESAAGIAALSKVLLQMRHAQLAPSLHADRLNPNIDFNQAHFVVQRKRCEWKAPLGADGSTLPRLAAVSSFGAGGSTAHLVVEEHLEPRLTDAGRPNKELLLFSAHTPTALQQQMRAIAAWLRRYQAGNVLRLGCIERSLSDVAQTLHDGRTPRTYRLAMIADNLSDAIDKLENIAGEDFSDYPRHERGIGVFRGVVEDAPFQAVASEIPSRSELEDLADQWISGTLAAWPEPVHGSVMRRRVPLPGTALQMRRLWPEERKSPNAPTEDSPSSASRVPGPVTPREIYERVLRKEITMEHAKSLLTEMQA